MARRDLSQADAAALVLQRTGHPMHRNDITDAIIKAGFQVWGRFGPGRTPEESVGRAITQEIRRRGDESRFEYVNGKGSGVFRLRPRADGTGSLRADSEPGTTREPQLAREPWLPERPLRLREPRVTETLDDLIEDVLRHGLDPVPFICRATREALRKLELQRLEKEHAEGYQRVPVQPDEFGDGDASMWDEL